MSFSTFSSFLQKLAFQRCKSQLKSKLFDPAFALSAFQLKMRAEKQKQAGPKEHLAKHSKFPGIIIEQLYQYSEVIHDVAPKPNENWSERWYHDTIILHSMKHHCVQWK
jgi:hypothetical protein